MTWDPSCDFLLSMPLDNLYEAIGPSGDGTQRCKGCGAVMPKSERTIHRARHQAGRTRSARAAQARANAQRLLNLEKARQARHTHREPPQEPLCERPVLPVAATEGGEPVAHAAPTPRRSVTAPPPPPPVPARL